MTIKLHRALLALFCLVKVGIPSANASDQAIETALFGSNREKRMELLRIECEGELRSRRVPTSCYRKPLISSREARRWLQVHCIEAISRSRSLKELAHAASEIPPGDRCRVEATRRLRELRHELRDQAPVEVWRSLGPVQELLSRSSRPMVGQGRENEPR
jgi:hypothetical protein